MAEVEVLVEDMQKNNCKPDDITWSMVAKGHCVNGDLEKALTVFNGLLADVNSNTVIVYNTILDGCVKHNRFDIADTLLTNMKKWGIEPSNFTLGIIVKMWGRRRQLSKALQAVK